MSYVENPNPAPQYNFAAYAAEEARASFITKTYMHLVGAIFAFVALEAVLLNLPGIDGLVQTMLGGRWSWAIVLGLFMVVSWIANSWATSTTSIGTQYMGLALYVGCRSGYFCAAALHCSTFWGRECHPDWPE